jgi:two-component system LytT family sensor kinase
VDVEPAALRCEVPAFLLNPLVENAVKHGVAAPNWPLVVRVTARLVEPDRLMLMVENSGEWKGKGLRARAAGERDDGELGGLGLANVRARLRAIYPGDHRVGMEHGCGRVRFMVELPARFRGEARA